MRSAQNADTHALKQHRLSQNISFVCSSFVLVIASDMHLEPETEKRAKNVDFHTVEKKNMDTSNTFSLFWDEFLETDLRPIYCSLTTYPSPQTPSFVVWPLPSTSARFGDAMEGAQPSPPRISPPKQRPLCCLRSLSTRLFLLLASVTIWIPCTQLFVMLREPMARNQLVITHTAGVSWWSAVSFGTQRCSENQVVSLSKRKHQTHPLGIWNSSATIPAIWYSVLA